MDRSGACFFEGEGKKCTFEGPCPHRGVGGVCLIEDSELLTHEEYLSSKVLAMEVTRNSQILLTRMRTLRGALDNAKDQKLLARWEKYGDYRQYDLSDLIGAWESEALELDGALASHGPTAILEEMVDVINQLEFIYDVLELWKC